MITTMLMLLLAILTTLAASAVTIWTWTRRVHQRLDTQAETMIILAGLVYADQPDEPPEQQERHLRICH